MTPAKEHVGSDPVLSLGQWDRRPSITSGFPVQLTLLRAEAIYLASCPNVATGSVGNQ